MAFINGKVENINEISLEDYLNSHNYLRDGVVVELNGEILDKGLYENTILKNTDTVEIFMFMGGG